MARKDPKGDTRTRNGDSPASAGRIDSSSDQGLLYQPGEAEVAKSLATVAYLQFLCVRDDGWLRCSPDTDSGQVYWKWKYTAGLYAGSYVMVVFPTYQVAEALERLIWKLGQVERGIIKPTKDTWFTDL